MRQSWKRALLPVGAVVLLQCDILSPSDTVDVSINRCTGDDISFVAVQNDGGEWTPVTVPATGPIKIKVSKNRAGVAFTTDFFGPATAVAYASAAELTQLFSSPTCYTDGAKTLNGTISQLDSNHMALISLQRYSTIVFPGASTFQLVSVPSGPLDLMAELDTAIKAGPSSYIGGFLKLVLRRAIDLPSGSTIPVIDFNGAEPFVPASAAITHSSVGSEFRSLRSNFISSGGLDYEFYGQSVSGNTITVHGIPATRTQPGDLHVLKFYAYPTSNMTARSVVVSQRDIVDQTITLGAPIATPAITTLSTSPLRQRVLIDFQADYPGFVSASFSQTTGTFSARSFQVLVSASYFQSSPAIWSVEIPDLGNVSGFPADADLDNSNPVTWAVRVGSAPPSAFGSPVPAGTVVRSAVASSDSSASYLLYLRSASSSGVGPSIRGNVASPRKPMFPWMMVRR